MIMKNPHIFPMLLLLAAAGCVKESTDNPNRDKQAYFDSWRAINYPDAVKTGLGIYVIEDIPGTGAEWQSGTSYCYLDYVIRNFSGTITASTTEAAARQLGTWSAGNYYGPRYFTAGENLSYAGVDEILRGMRSGGTRTAIIPTWLMCLDRHDTENDYLAAESTTDGAIYTITFYKQVDNVFQEQYDELKDYATKHWGVTDTTSAGIFFRSLRQPSTVTFPSDTTVYINYTGRLPGGTVFDTNVADTAKVYGLYASGKSYAPVAVTWAAESKDIKMAGTTPVTGFQAGLFQMHPGEKATFVFSSTYGYGASGKGSLIPPYAPLIFDVELVEKP